MPSGRLTRGYTQYPSVDLPERWPLVTDQEARSAEPGYIDKDARLVNAYAELNPKTGEWMVEKRPGYHTGLNHVPGGNGLGIYNWLGDIYSVFSSALYKDFTPFAPGIDSGSYYRFQQVLGATPRLVLKNLAQGWYTDGTVLTQITDVDYPALTCVGLAYLDGTLYVLRPDGGIQGSAIDDPATWDPLNVIIARNEPDKGVAIIKHGTYVVALKEWSTQAFYNAGNVTGSPLGRVDGAMFYYGCRNGNSVVEIDGMHFWVSSNRFAGCQLVKLESLQLSVVSTPVIDRFLTDFGAATVGFGMKLCGHRFYVLLVSAANFTLVYDLDTKIWSRWTDTAGTSFWPFSNSTYDGLGRTIIQHNTNSRTYFCESDFVQPTDDGVIFPVDIYTGNFDFGVNRRKQLNFMAFDTDVVPGSILQVRNNDNDYEAGKWTNFRNVNLGQKRPILTKCGSFYQRAIHLHHARATPFRIKAIDLQLDIGTL